MLSNIMLYFSSRYVVKKNETSKGDNDVTVTSRSEKISGKESVSYVLEYHETNETTLFLDATQIKITYGMATI